MSAARRAFRSHSSPRQRTARSSSAWNRTERRQSAALRSCGRRRVHSDIDGAGGSDRPSGHFEEDCESDARHRCLTATRNGHVRSSLASAGDARSAPWSTSSTAQWKRKQARASVHSPSLPRPGAASKSIGARAGCRMGCEAKTFYARPGCRRCGRAAASPRASNFQRNGLYADPKTAMPVTGIGHVEARDVAAYFDELR